MDRGHRRSVRAGTLSVVSSCGTRLESGGGRIAWSGNAVRNRCDERALRSRRRSRRGIVGSVQRGGECSANFRIVFVDGLRDVEIELLAGGYADVKAITFDRLQDLLGVPIEDSLRTLKRRILQTGQSE